MRGVRTRSSRVGHREPNGGYPQRAGPKILNLLLKRPGWGLVYFGKNPVMSLGEWKPLPGTHLQRDNTRTNAIQVAPAAA